MKKKASGISVGENAPCHTYNRAVLRFRTGGKTSHRRKAACP